MDGSQPRHPQCWPLLVPSRVCPVTTQHKKLPKRLTQITSDIFDKLSVATEKLGDFERHLEQRQQKFLYHKLVLTTLQNLSQHNLVRWNIQASAGLQTTALSE